MHDAVGGAYGSGVTRRQLVSPQSGERHCDACGRRMTWRKAWEAAWPEVRWCSDACRRRKVRAVDQELERAISALLAQSTGDATICPSEAARAVGAADWRDLMEPARAAARRLAVRGEIDIVQGGRVVDGSTAKGPIRLRRRRDAA